MSLDVYLEDEAGNEFYWANITHNLRKMAEAAGIYACLWRPEENGIVKAQQIIEPLAEGLSKISADEAKFEAFNAPNGWGKLKDFLPWCEKYLQACRENPDAFVRVSR